MEQFLKDLKELVKKHQISIEAEGRLTIDDATGKEKRGNFTIQWNGYTDNPIRCKLTIELE